MRTIIAGSRTLEDYGLVVDAVNQAPWEPTVVLNGCAKGVDVSAERWAMANHVPVENYPADWQQFGKAAGPIRNREMAEHAEALIAIWDGKSMGTKNMIELAQKAGLSVYVHTVL